MLEDQLNSWHSRGISSESTASGLLNRVTRFTPALQPRWARLQDGILSLFEDSPLISVTVTPIGSGISSRADWISAGGPTIEYATVPSSVNSAGGITTTGFPVTESSSFPHGLGGLVSDVRIEGARIGRSQFVRQHRRNRLHRVREPFAVALDVVQDPEFIAGEAPLHRGRAINVGCVDENVVHRVNLGLATAPVEQCSNVFHSCTVLEPYLNPQTNAALMIRFPGEKPSLP